MADHDELDACPIPENKDDIGALLELVLALKYKWKPADIIGAFRPLTMLPIGNRRVEIKVYRALPWG